MEKKGNPAVVGLAGFGLTTLLLQLHNLGLIGLGPVVAAGFIFGGLAQLIAGFQENKAGNNFGYSAFVSYGAFWIGLVSIWVLNHFGIYESSSH
ncbi:MAG: acetate uptake transporter, partial [Tannerellaceae bacterium]